MKSENSYTKGRDVFHIIKKHLKSFFLERVDFMHLKQYVFSFLVQVHSSTKVVVALYILTSFHQKSVEVWDKILPTKKFIC